MREKGKLKLCGQFFASIIRSPDIFMIFFTDGKLLAEVSGTIIIIYKLGLSVLISLYDIYVIYINKIFNFELFFKIPILCAKFSSWSTFKVAIFQK